MTSAHHQRGVEPVTPREGCSDRRRRCGRYRRWRPGLQSRRNMPARPLEWPVKNKMYAAARSSIISISRVFRESKIGRDAVGGTYFDDIENDSVLVFSYDKIGIAQLRAMVGGVEGGVCRFYLNDFRRSAASHNDRRCRGECP